MPIKCPFSDRLAKSMILSPIHLVKGTRVHFVSHCEYFHFVLGAFILSIWVILAWSATTEKHYKWRPMVKSDLSPNTSMYKTRVRPQKKCPGSALVSMHGTLFCFVLTPCGTASVSIQQLYSFCIKLTPVHLFDNKWTKGALCKSLVCMCICVRVCVHVHIAWFNACVFPFGRNFPATLANLVVITKACWNLCSMCFSRTRVSPSVLRDFWNQITASMQSVCFPRKRNRLDRQLWCRPEGTGEL